MRCVVLLGIFFLAAAVTGEPACSGPITSLDALGGVGSELKSSRSSFNI